MWKCCSWRNCDPERERQVLKSHHISQILPVVVHVSRVRGAGWAAQSLAVREMQFWVILAKHLRHQLSWLTL